MGFYIGNAKASRPREGFIPNPKLKLLDQVSEVMRFKHYSIRTETTYREWIKRFILFHGKRHPREMGAVEVERFLSDLATRRRVAASTQNQAFNALLFLYRCDPSPGSGLRYPHRTRLAGAQRCFDHANLHPCNGETGTGCSQPAG